MFMFNRRTIALRSRSSSGLISQRRPPSTAPSDHGSPRDGDSRRDNNTTTEFRNNQSPPGTPGLASPRADGWKRLTAGEGGTGITPVGGVLGEEFEEEVERQRAAEVAAEWGRKRGSGKRTKTRERVRQPWSRSYPLLVPTKIPQPAISRAEKCVGLLAVRRPECSGKFGLNPCPACRRSLDCGEKVQSSPQQSTVPMHAFQENLPVTFNNPQLVNKEVSRVCRGRVDSFVADWVWLVVRRFGSTPFGIT